METPGDIDVYPVSSSSTSGSGSSASRFGVQFPSLSLFQSPLSVILEYSGIIPSAPTVPESESPVLGASAGHIQTESPYSEARNGGSGEEVSIRIIGSSEAGSGVNMGDGGGQIGCDDLMDIAAESDDLLLEAASTSSANVMDSADSSRDSGYQRYDLQRVGRWIEQILPFSLLLLVVFIRQHLQAFFVTIWIAAVMFKSNDILRKQTALKGERKNSVLVSISVVFIVYVVGVYWWYRNDGALYPLLMLPPKSIPPFWHAIFMIMLNDIMVRQAAMSVKCLLLIYYKNSRGHNFRCQGQMLTLVEYTMLLYRALLPAPVWYRFFLNKDYGSLFSSLTTGLYLTFKLTSVVEKLLFRSGLSLLRLRHCHTRKCIMDLMPQKSRSMLLETCVLYVRRRCTLRYCCSVNTSFVRNVFQNGLREKGLALYAGLWLDRQICSHLGMDQQVYSSSCFEMFLRNSGSAFSSCHLYTK
ncbi:RING finger and transmembrane domain-containing protein 2 isoform X1 [Eucalyptus grandis]|uniref:RING finger and transmembrane domain-containing protein 2 isoform X1 n=1 Tax=Eucalyptus grandis TaxID=71139 RepID=UPI00192EFCDC|nr:RING finger and transmembrane domain-containing protein 2 isoform X1 [Eucalyptus grandis]